MEINKEPSLVDKAKNLTTAAVNWAKKDGFSRVPDEIFQARKSICLACPNWDMEAFNNTGRCKICGCSVAKLYIPSAKCPDTPPKWDVVNA